MLSILLQVFTAGRFMSIVTGILGLVSIIIGRQALVRSRRGSGSSRAMIALAMGLIGALLSILHLATATGGFGTGSGKLGAIVAMVVGLIGSVFGAMALQRLRQVKRQQ